MSNELIKLPANATEADLRALCSEGEIWATVSVATGEKPRFESAAGRDIIGKRLVTFVKFFEETPGVRRRPGSGVFAGWKKMVSNYVVTGAGESWKCKQTAEQVCYYYVREV